MNYVLTSWLFSQLPQQFNTSMSQRWTVQFLGCSTYGMEEPNFISLCTELPQSTPSDLSLNLGVLKGPTSTLHSVHPLQEFPSDEPRALLAGHCPATGQSWLQGPAANQAESLTL